MPEKISVSRLIEDLEAKGVYDFLTQRKLETLNKDAVTASSIWEKERFQTQRVFSEYLEKLETDGFLTFKPLVKWELNNAKGMALCEIDRFLGYGNEGPVYSVNIKGKPFALKLYSAAELNYLAKAHGRYGLGGFLLDVQSIDVMDLSKLGAEILSKKEKGIYARSKKIVQLHNVGVVDNLVCLVMDLLDVDPISKLKPLEMGAAPEDTIAWAIDCAIGLCQLHLEEQRLHLNIRPEAFIRRSRQKEKRLPKYTFFHYPKAYKRSEGSMAQEIEFIMVDHMDNSVETSDKNAKGMATFGAWTHLAPETLMTTLKSLREDYETYIQKGESVQSPLTIKAHRTQMEDIWALGLTLYQFLADGKYPFGDLTNLSEMVNSILLKPIDFSLVPDHMAEIIKILLEKDPKKRYQALMKGLPSEISQRKSAAQALLYRLELMAEKG